MKKLFSKSVLLAFLAAAATLAAVPSHAFGDANYYAGIQASSHTLKANGVSSSSETFPSLFAGVNFGGPVGLEVSTGSKSISGGKFRFTDLVGTYSYNLSQNLDLIGTFGLRHSDQKHSVQGNYSGTSFVFGGGVAYNFSDQVFGRVMFDYAPKTFGESIRNSTVSAGVGYRF